MKSLEIIFTLISVILTVITTYKWKKLNNKGKVSFIFVILSAIIIAINSYRDTKKEYLIERVNAKFGEIKTDRTPFRIITLGNTDNGISIKLEKGVLAYAFFDTSLELSLKNKKLLINVIIRDLKGDVIAVIEDNTWTVFDSDYEYNNDDETFELVTKGERKVFFQIDYRNKKVYFSGYLLNNKGYGQVIFNNPKRNFNSQIYFFLDEFYKSQIPEEINIPRIFKYPRDKYLGVRL